MTMIHVGRSVVGARSTYLLLIGMGLGYVAGIAATPSSTAQAEVTEEPRREAFKAGSVLNEPVLREIAATLVRIETRIERFEKHLAPQTPVKAAPGKSLPVNKPKPINKN